MTFKKGESGNAKGRPPKNRTLTTILEKAGNAKHDYGGTPVSAKHLIASLLWQAAAEGQVLFPDGTIMRLDIEDWIGVNKFIYQHIDGPPKAEVDVDGKIIVTVTYGNDGTDSPATKAAPETA